MPYVTIAGKPRRKESRRIETWNKSLSVGTFNDDE